MIGQLLRDPMRAPRQRPFRVAQLMVVAALASVAALAWFAGAALAQDEPEGPPKAFRPCVDPNNLPFSDSKGNGFENKIADLFAQKLGVPVKSYLIAERMNFIRNSLRYHLPGEPYRCDVMMGLPEGYDQAWVTKPYFRSTYVLMYVKGKGLDSVRSESDFFALPPEQLHRLRIGVYDRSPASRWLVKHDLLAQGVPFRMMSPDPSATAGDLIEKELVAGNVDVAVIWGPVGGYYARESKVPLAVVPLVSEPPDVRFDYAIGMGVRYGDKVWKDRVESLIASNQDAITGILKSYGVPLVDEHGQPLP